jgi:D-alanyl-D-alanine carboxypeptidase
VDGTLQPANQTDANPSWAWTAGGAISTVDDLAVYAKALVGGGLLDPAMQKTRLDSVVPTNPANPEIGYGFGLGHFGGTAYGHSGQVPGFSSRIIHDPENDITVVIVTNLSAVPATGENAAVAVYDAIAPALFGASTAPSGDPAAAGTSSAPGATGTP